MTLKTNPTRIFVVEDDSMYQRMLRYVMEMNPDHEVHVFATGKECLEHLRLKPDIISLDYTLPDMKGEDVFKKIHTFDQEISVIIISGQQDVGTAVKLLREGAFDYITKDNETKERLLHTLQRIKDHRSLKREVDQLRIELGTRYEFGKFMIGESKPMQEVFRLMEKAVSTNITVSISGETGAGKEVVAKSIHLNGPRRKGPFVAVNMSAIPRELVESELFGYEKGAFTGALARKKGQFELADGGTLFLDEIAEMDMSMQAKLLRALQEREFIRVGGEKPIGFDARLVIATHKDLAEEVRVGRFREDLYYRLLGLPIHLPPLRDRGNDVILLAQTFLDEYAQTHGMNTLSLSKSAKSKLLNYDFPGNVRELKAVMQLAAVMSGADTVEPEDIQFRSVRKESGFFQEDMTLEEYKNRIIRQYLEKYDNDVLLVARKLDIGKSTIYRLLKENNI